MSTRSVDGAPVWTYQPDGRRSLHGTFFLTKHAVPAATLPVALPTFYDEAAPPPADTAWPDANVAPRRRLRSYRNLLLYPRHVLVNPRRERLVPVTFKKSRHHRHGGLLGLGDEQFALRDTALFGAQPTRTRQPVYLADTEYPGIFGHDLVEVFTAAWAWSQAGRDAVFTTSTPLSRHLLDLLGAVGVPASSVRQLTGPTLASRVLFPEPSVLARRFVHPVAFDLFERARSALHDPDVPTPERVYVSRSRVSGRALVNELEIEEIARELGFAVHHPQEMSIAEQITVFTHARLIMGPGGSAMHHAVFSDPAARVLCLSSPSWITVIDSLLDRGHGRLGYVMGDLEPTRSTRRRHQGAYRVDPQRVRRAIRAHFDL